jgi:predicted P-loop ATPase
MEKIEDQAPKEHKKNWREVYSSVDEIKDFLANRIFLRHNVITRRVEYRLASSFTQDFMPYWQPIEDRVVNSLWTKMCRIKPTRVQDIFRVIESDYVPDFNPFTDYLEHLPPWDGCNNILVLSASVRVKGGVKKQELFYKYLRKWLVAMVAAWVDPNEVNHEILVFIGDQGIYKTTWFQYLLPPQLRDYFYTKTNANRMGRDDLLTLAQYGLVCCEELDTMRPSELNQLKAAVTMQSIDERAAYARYHEHRNHIASFCGTGNNIQFLNDLTGNRRWLPFEVDFIENPRTNPIDYEAVFSEAYALYQKEDFHHWLNYNEMEQLSVHNETFEATQQELELIRQTFRLPGPGEKGEFITRTGIMQAIGWNPALHLDVNKIGPAMKKLGFERKRTSSERGYVVCRYNEMEKCERKWAMAEIAKDEDDPESDNNDTGDTVFI